MSLYVFATKRPRFETHMFTAYNLFPPRASLHPQMLINTNISWWIDAESFVPEFIPDVRPITLSIYPGVALFHR